MKTADSVNQSDEYLLVGTVVQGELSSDEFSLVVRVTAVNEPPTLNLPSVASFDLLRGGEAFFSVTDQESPAEDLTLKLELDDNLRNEFTLFRGPQGRGIRYSPKRLRSRDIIVGLIAEDPQGKTIRSAVKFQLDVQDPSLVLINKLGEIKGVELAEAPIEPSLPGGVQFAIGDSKLQIVQLAATPDRTGLPFKSLAEPYQVFVKDRVSVACESPTKELTDELKKILGLPLVDKQKTPVVSKEIQTKLLATVKRLHEEKKLFQRQSFSDLVFAYVDDFENDHKVVLQQKLNDLPKLKSFLEENKGFKAELYLAIDPAYDNLASALNVVNEILEKHPKEILPYKNLAIAIAVCWDVPRANYSFVGHQRRTKSTLPKNLTGALDNFRHFVSYQAQMQGRAQWLPWEFLVHVINHQTPDEEKSWALKNYLATRVNFGQCYKDVPYDYEMLNTGSRVCKLNGQEYSLPNLRSIGGVCAMQADFAARVGKSLGVPAEYVGGQSASGGNHAWVMWVEVKNVTKNSIQFSLESYGRYRGDLYYVGNLKDPKSGQRITDRQLELRLHTVGIDAYAKRHVDLIMRAYPEWIKSQELEWDLKKQLDFLEDTIKLCPWHEQAWEAVADLIAGSEIDRKMNRQMNQVLNSMFSHFSAFPDFTWKIFDRLVSFVQKDEDRNKYYVKLLNLYVEGKRPDLACEAQLKLTDYLEEQGKTEVAMQGLAVTLKTFPDEGRYVPRLLDRLEKLCGDDAKMLQQLVQFHIEFLPTIPQKRGSRASKYCMKMYERAIQFFTKHGVTEWANAYQLKLQELQRLQQK